MIISAGYSEFIDNRLVVTGNAEIKVPADRAEILFVVSGFASSLKGAVNEAQYKVENITDKLYKIGITKNDLTTMEFYSGEYLAGKSWFSRSKDFTTNLSTKITIRDLEKLDDVIYILSNEEIQNVSEISFHLENFEDVKFEAREKAIKIAEKKAIQIADLTKIEIVKVSYFEDLYSDAQYSNFLSPYANTSTKIFPSTITDLETGGSGLFSNIITVTSSVKIVYEIK